MEKCFYCGQRIVFRKLKSGESIACNPHPEYYIPDETAATEFITGGGELIKARKGTAYGVPARISYMPHWTTCKQMRAARERRLKKLQAEREAEEKVLKRCAEIQAAYEAEQKAPKQISFFNF